MNTTAMLFAMPAMVAAALMPATWNLAFLVSGSVLYYSLLHLLGVPASGELTGVVFGGAAIAAIAKLAWFRRRSPSHAMLVLAALFCWFAFSWYLRWIEAPPRADSYEQFGDRVYVSMAVFGVLAFLGGLSVHDEQDVRQLIQAVAALGLASLIVVLLYWWTGQSGQQSNWDGRWAPIPFLSGITLSFELGLGFLAFSSEVDERRGWRWQLLRLVVVGALVAVCVRVGQRGPLVFLVPSVLVGGLMRSRSGRIRSWTRVAFLASVALAVVLETAKAYESSRAAQGESYTLESNANRVELAIAGTNFFAERPLIGWGGELVGKPLESGAWQYSHIWMLDSLIETGLMGGMAHWGLVILVLARLSRRWRQSDTMKPVIAGFVPVLLYAFFEGQVSGHVSMAKHLWMFLGVAGAAATWRLEVAKNSARDGQKLGRQEAKIRRKGWAQ